MRNKKIKREKSFIYGDSNPPDKAKTIHIDALLSESLPTELSMMITSKIQNTHLKPKCVQPPLTCKQFQCFDFNVYKHENVNMVIISW